MCQVLKGKRSTLQNWVGLSVYYWAARMFWIRGPSWLCPPSKPDISLAHLLIPETDLLSHSAQPLLYLLTATTWLSLWSLSLCDDDPQPKHLDFDAQISTSRPGLFSDWPCQTATHISAWWVPMARVMTLNLSRTSLTIMLFWSGVERQHRTDRQYWVNSRNFSSSFPWRMAFRVFPSMTNPTSGTAALEA